MNNLKNKKKFLALGAVLLLVLGASFIFPRKTAADMPVAVTASAPQSADDILAANKEAAAKAKASLMNNWKYVTLQALTTALDTAAQTIAKNYATWLASGGAGKSPLAWLKSFDKIAEESFENAASDFLNTLTTKYTGYGLCQPVDPTLTLNIKLGIFRDLQPPKPKCTWSQFTKNYDKLKGSLASGAFLKNFSVAFQPAQNDIDNAIKLHYAARNEAQTVKTAAILDASTNGRFKSLVAPISGDVKTPASMIEGDIKGIEVNAKEKSLQNYTATISYVDAATDALTGIATNAGKMFLNTLANKLVTKYTQGGMFSLADIICKTQLAGDLDVCKKNGASGVADTAVSGDNAVALASSYFSSILAPSQVTLSDFSLLSDLQTCPSGAAARGVYNCAIDQKFATALQKQSSGGYLTVSEALSQNLIDDMLLIGPSDPNDGLPDCYTKGYCWTNLRKLRHADIIPVGWEMAAFEVQSGQKVKLSDVMKKFTDCNSSGALDADHPWCHLIDPDWVLKIPIEQCNSLVNGQTLEAPSASGRAQVCADLASCLAEDANGKCVVTAIARGKKAAGALTPIRVRASTRVASRIQKLIWRITSPTPRPRGSAILWITTAAARPRPAAALLR
jgi:hypothetical protein